MCCLRQLGALLSLKFEEIMTYQTLKRVLHYCPDSGEFTWTHDEKVRLQSRGKPAGCLKSNGYIQLSYNKKKYYGQILAVLYMTKRFPQFRVRHKNNNRSDNSYINLLDREPGYYSE